MSFKVIDPPDNNLGYVHAMKPNALQLSISQYPNFCSRFPEQILSLFSADVLINLWNNMIRHYFGTAMFHFIMMRCTLTARFFLPSLSLFESISPEKTVQSEHLFVHSLPKTNPAHIKIIFLLGKFIFPCIKFCYVFNEVHQICIVSI